MKRFLVSIAVLLSFVWTVPARQELYYKTDLDIQQKGGYNDVFEHSSAEGEGKDWPMGCMATAMTILMDYHQYPESHGGGAYDFGSVAGLSRVMYDAAKSIDTQFGATESSAALSTVALKLVEDFGYDVNSVRYLLKSSYSDAEWVALIVRNIQNGMPVIYSAGAATAPGAGGAASLEKRHAFVIDGIRSCDEAGYAYEFHVNGGQGPGVEGNDQWVKDIFNVTIGETTYSSTPEMVVGIRTAYEVEAHVSDLKIVSYNGSHGLSMESDAVQLGVPCNISVSALQNWNDDGDAFKGAVYPVLVRTDVDGKLVVCLPSNTDDIAVKYGGYTFKYRSVVPRLDFNGVVFDKPEGEEAASVDMTRYTLRMATCPLKKDGVAYDYAKCCLVGVLEGEGLDVLSSLPALQPNTVKVTFVTEGNQVVFERRVVDGGLAFEPVTEMTVPYGKPFLFFVKKGAGSTGTGTVILTTGGKYLMKDFFASAQWGGRYPEGAFYVTPTGDMTITGKFYNTNNLVKETVSGLEAGTLAGRFEDPCNVGSLEISGDMNADDFFYIRDNMPLLTDLDLADVNIIATGSYPANTIPDAAFYKEVFNSAGYTLALRTVRLPETCEAIGNNAFMYCQNLTTVYIPKNVGKFYYNVFYGCKGLADIYVYNPVPVFINWCVFKNSGANSVLHVPYGTKGVYLKQNSLPGAIWAQNNWYENWKGEGRCVEMAASTEKQMKVRVLRTNYVTFDASAGGKAGGATYSYVPGEDFRLVNGAENPVSLALWMLRAQVKYVKGDGTEVEDYVYDEASTLGTTRYAFDLKEALTTAHAEGAKDVYVKVEVYLDMTKAVEKRMSDGKSEFHPNLYAGMDVTVINGWHPSADEGKALDFAWFDSNLRGQPSNLSGKATLTLDNARVGRINTWIDMDVVLKGENEMAGYVADYDDVSPMAINWGATVTIKGNGSVHLPDYWIDRDGTTRNEAGCYIRSYGDGGSLNICHGATLEGLENVHFDQIKLYYTRTFDRVVTNAEKKALGWETLALPFDVYRVQKSNGRPLYWATSGKTGDFWLREMQDGELEFTSSVENIQAGKSYIISVPDQGSANLVGQPLTFVGPTLTGNVKLVQEDELAGFPSFVRNTSAGNVAMEMKPYLYAGTLPGVYYSMNRDGSSFYKNGAEGENIVPLNQFEAYFEADDAAALANVAAFSLGGQFFEEDATGISDAGGDVSTLSVHGGKGSLTMVSGTARRVDIVSMGGIVRSVQVGEGTTTVNLPAGIYVVEGKKVAVGR